MRPGGLRNWVSHLVHCDRFTCKHPRGLTAAALTTQAEPCRPLGRGHPPVALLCPLPGAPSPLGLGPLQGPALPGPSHPLPATSTLRTLQHRVPKPMPPPLPATATWCLPWAAHHRSSYSSTAPLCGQLPVPQLRQAETTRTVVTGTRASQGAVGHVGGLGTGTWASARLLRNSSASKHRKDLSSQGTFPEAVSARASRAEALAPAGTQSCPDRRPPLQAAWRLRGHSDRVTTARGQREGPTSCGHHT